ncbi:MAG: nuclear transport factor 2 family protein [Actinomycetota bacterium]|nr:nuclear transport factor 2 family protein [Actinomycetota bacterium]
MSDHIEELLDRAAIGEVVTKLFVYTDQARWADLVGEVFAPEVHFDGGFGEPAATVPAQTIADGWRDGLAGLDSVHHQAGNQLITLDGDRADVHADAIAVHSKESATNGRTRTFVGSYDIGVRRGDDGWRIDKFVYHLKVVDGNADLS